MGTITKKLMENKNFPLLMRDSGSNFCADFLVKLSQNELKISFWYFSLKLTEKNFCVKNLIFGPVFGLNTQLWR